MRNSRAILWLLMLVTLIPVRNSLAQTSIICGDIVTGEFTTEFQQHQYQINLKPGYVLRVRAEESGGTLALNILVQDPIGKTIAAGGDDPPFHGFVPPTSKPTAETPNVSASGRYNILITNSNVEEATGRVMNGGSAGIGLYTLSIGCTLDDGTTVNPGDTMPASVDTLEPPAPSASSLAPTDLSAVNKLPLPPGTPMAGFITNDERISFIFDAQGGEKYDLAFAKVSGNLNLGMVVLSPTNQVLFYGGLIASETLTTRLTLAEPGQYTIGVFRVDLAPPDAPEATAFQVTVTQVS